MNIKIKNLTIIIVMGVIILILGGLLIFKKNSSSTTYIKNVYNDENIIINEDNNTKSHANIFNNHQNMLIETTSSQKIKTYNLKITYYDSENKEVNTEEYAYELNNLSQDYATIYVLPTLADDKYAGKIVIDITSEVIDDELKYNPVKFNIVASQNYSSEKNANTITLKATNPFDTKLQSVYGIVLVYQNNKLINAVQFNFYDIEAKKEMTTTALLYGEKYSNIDNYQLKIIINDII